MGVIKRSLGFFYIVLLLIVAPFASAVTTTYPMAFYVNHLVVEIPVGIEKLKFLVDYRTKTALLRTARETMIEAEQTLEVGHFKLDPKSLPEYSTEGSVIAGVIGRDVLDQLVVYIDLKKREITLEQAVPESKQLARKWFLNVAEGGKAVFSDAPPAGSKGIGWFTSPFFEYLAYCPDIHRTDFPKDRVEKAVPSTMTEDGFKPTVVRGNFGLGGHTAFVSYQTALTNAKDNVVFGLSLLPSSHVFIDFSTETIGYATWRPDRAMGESFMQLLRLPADVKGDDFFIFEDLGKSTDWGNFEDKAEGAKLVKVGGVPIEELYSEYRLGNFDRLVKVMADLADDDAEVVMKSPEGKEISIAYGW